MEVGKSQENINNLVTQDVPDEPKLDAWQSYIHPDIVDVCEEEYEYQPVRDTEPPVSIGR